MATEKVVTCRTQQTAPVARPSTGHPKARSSRPARSRGPG